jgi:hypothetical protein
MFKALSDRRLRPRDIELLYSSIRSSTGCWSYSISSPRFLHEHPTRSFALWRSVLATSATVFCVPPILLYSMSPNIMGVSFVRICHASIWFIANTVDRRSCLPLHLTFTDCSHILWSMCNPAQATLTLTKVVLFPTFPLASSDYICIRCSPIARLFSPILLYTTQYAYLSVILRCITFSPPQPGT